MSFNSSNVPTLSSGASPWLGSPGGVIGIANDQIASADGYLGALADAAAAIVPPVVEAEFVTGPDAPPLERDTLPELEAIVWEDLTAPGDFDLAAPAMPVFPEFTGEPPVSTDVSPPSPDFGVLPTPPGITDLSVPDVSVTLPAPPALLSLSVVPFDGVTLPTFSEELPVLAVVEPTIAAYAPGEQYTSALLTALKTTLQQRITEGGTGLAPDVEQALWDRARERELKSMQDAIDDLERMETLGYAFPPGVYLDSRLKVRTEYGKVEAGLSRDIAIKQAELELSNVQEALKIATQLEGQLLDYVSRIEQRVFEAAKYTTEAGIAIYNAKIQAYAALLDAFKTKVQIYEARIRGELAKVEVYKAQIDAEKLKADINQSLVAQYRTQVDASLSTIEVYKARIQGIVAAADVQRTRVQAYGEQVRAYAAGVSAFTAQVEGYRAQVQADVAKQDAYRSRVQAYAAQVEAVASQSRAQADIYKSRIDAYTAEWDGYRAQAAAQGERVRALASINTATADMYRAQTGAVTSFNEVLTKQWQVVLDQTQRTAEIAVAASRATGEMYISTRSIIADAAKVGAQVAAQLGAAALNALNWSNSYGVSTSFSASASNNSNYNTNVNL